MDYSFLYDPNAIAETLATAEPELRAMQRARGWDDKTLAIEIATIRHKNEEAEWKERVLRMSDEELQQEDDVLRAKLDPCVAKYRAMSGAQRDQVASAMMMKLKWGKDRLAFIQQEREFREEKKRYSQRLPAMSDEVLRTEIVTITEQLKIHNDNLVSLPINHDITRKEIERRSKMLKAKFELVVDEHVIRGQKQFCPVAL